MDDEQYRQAREALAQPRCLYEKAIQYGYFGCHQAQRMALGEREGVHCGSAPAFKLCESYYSQCLSKSGFALGDAKLALHLTFNKAMKVQIGGMQGAIRLSGVTEQTDNPGKAKTLYDITDCLAGLEDHNSGFELLDYSLIVPFIQQFTLREGKRSRKKR